MKKVLAGAVLAFASLLIYRLCADYDSDKRILKENSMLIQEQLKNVSKLVVTEGHFAEVYNYADSKELFGSLFTADKKALVVVNAKVSIAYDLSKVDFKVDEASKTVFVENLPKPEVDINPDFEYYDVSADYLNPFEADDYNAIKEHVKTSLLKKVEASPLKSNARNRLLSELSKLLVLTNAMGWKLVHEGKSLNDLEALRFNDGLLVN